MLDISVPPAHRPALEMLARIDDDAASLVIERIGALDSFEKVQILAEAIEFPLLADHKPLGEPLAVALLSMAANLRTSSPLDIAEGVAGSPNLSLDELGRETLESRLGKLLAARSVRTTSIAIDLLTLNERNYQSARIITDLRPVFSEDTSETPDGAVIQATLHIQTWGREGSKSTFDIALDETDLRDLSQAVNRALEKAETLRQRAKDSDMRLFELDEKA